MGPHARLPRPLSSKSRAYSTTLGALRDVRRAWRTARADLAHARAGLPAHEEDTTLVTESSWTYLSSGYRPGEEFLAAQTRHEIAQAREQADRVKAEREVWR
ncbi:replication initiator [Streptomyces sp. NPDC049887]|uniref:replication initiator n=1 Tax=Streptomyces sp. NPDC049887 TaxID=3155654 RepID=UPI00343EC8D1